LLSTTRAKREREKERKNREKRAHPSIHPSRNDEEDERNQRSFFERWHRNDDDFSRCFQKRARKRKKNESGASRKMNAVEKTSSSSSTRARERERERTQTKERTIQIFYFLRGRRDAVVVSVGGILLEGVEITTFLDFFFFFFKSNSCSPSDIFLRSRVSDFFCEETTYTKKEFTQRSRKREWCVDLRVSVWGV